MAVLAITYGLYCGGEEIASRLSRHLDYEKLDESLYELSSRTHRVPVEELRRSLTDPVPPDGRLSIDRERNQAILQATLAEWIQSDGRIVTGCPALLIPGDISHVLKICIVADKSFRIALARENEELSDAEAQSVIRQRDEQLANCSATLVHRPPFDEVLYDIVIASHDTSIEDAVKRISAHANSDAVRITERSRRAVESFLLSSRVRLALTLEGYSAEIFVEEGRAVVGVNNRAFLMGRMMEKVRKLTASVPGIIDVQVKLGSKYTPSSLNPWEAVEAPPRVLLVDDEQEFVDTLSERLRSRDIESSIAYSGEEALEKLQSGGADVIVLDLLMPGIDGIETLRRVKQSHPEVEVIILTGHGSDREQAAAEDLGAFAYLRKPVNLNDLAQVMKEAYAQRKQNK